MNNQSSPQEQYKIILRHAKGWSNYKSARLHVSVLANPTFDPRIRSILNWALENFDDVILCLHDTIQRYNIMSNGVCPNESYKEALRNGDLWLVKNIFPADVLLDIVRWDQLLVHPHYVQIHQRISDLYQNNKEFSQAVDYDLDNFTQRCLKRGEKFDSERRILSRDFLLEEISAYIPLFQESSSVDIHPGMRMQAMNLLLKGVGEFNLQDNLMVTVKTYDVGTHVAPHTLPAPVQEHHNHMKKVG